MSFSVKAFNFQTAFQVIFFPLNFVSVSLVFCEEWYASLLERSLGEIKQ